MLSTVAALTLLTLPAAAGWQPPESATSTVEQKFEFSVASGRIWAVEGAPLVIPLDFGDKLRKGGAVRLSARGLGAEFAGRVVWYSLERDPAGWMRDCGRWQADDLRSPGVGYWALVCQPPKEASGRDLVLMGQSIALHWTPAGSVSGEASWRTAAARLPAGALPASLETALHQAQRSPLESWRSELLLPIPPEDAPGVFRREGAAAAAQADPIEALRKCVAARWRAAITNLWRDDRPVGERLLRRLTAVVDFGGGNVLPAWPMPVDGWSRLMDDLLDGSLTPAQRSARAQSWLQLQPEFRPWVVDDAGVKGSPGMSESGQVGIANLSGAGAVFRWKGELGADLLPLKDGESRLVPTPPRACDPPAGADLIGRLAWAASGVPQPFEAGASGASVRTLSIPIPAAPPGVPVGPLLEDWSLAAWLNDVPEPSSLPLTGRLVQQFGGAWMLELECGATGIEPEPGVRVHLGPTGAPRAVLAISPEGRMVDQVSGEATAVRVVHRPARDGQAASWAVWAPVPARAIEDGLLRMGVVRTDGAGRRAAWPRAMMPWQAEPGRLAIDLTAWSALDR